MSLHLVSLARNIGSIGLKVVDSGDVCPNNGETHPRSDDKLSHDFQASAVDGCENPSPVGNYDLATYETL